MSDLESKNYQKLIITLDNSEVSEVQEVNLNAYQFTESSFSFFKDDLAMKERGSMAGDSELFYLSSSDEEDLSKIAELGVTLACSDDDSFSLLLE